jgi:hypothetical protein
MNKFIIQDWAGNLMFNGKKFKSFDDAESYLSEFLNDDYETDREAYYILECT